METPRQCFRMEQTASMQPVRESQKIKEPGNKSSAQTVKHTYAVYPAQPLGHRDTFTLKKNTVSGQRQERIYFDFL